MKADRRPAKVTEPFTDASYDRRRLFRRLDAARRRPLVWLAAPPGAGKTTLVASYLRARRARGTWYRVDGGDTDAAGLFYYMRLALAHLDGPRRPPLPLWTAPSAGSLGPFARRFFEELFARLPPRALLVFDDYQEAPVTSSWTEALEVGLSAVPRGVNVVVTSRSPPPPAFARRIAAGEVELIAWDDLRLSLDEAAGIARLRAAGRRRVAPPAIERFHELTGGLAAGLVLLLASAAPDDEAVRAHAGHEFQEVFDYFTTELFERADADTQRFLLESAFLESMSEATVSLCAGASARRILRRLRRHEFFVDRLAGAQAHFRYHPLFRAFLLDRAAHTMSPEALREARCSAASLMLEDGQTEAAFSLYREAGDLDALAALVAREAPALLAQGRRQTLEGWLGSLPEDAVAGSGWLSLWSGVCAIGNAPRRAVAAFTRAFDTLSAARDAVGSAIAWAGAVQAIMLEGEDFSRLDLWLARKGAELPPLDARLPADVALRLATARLLALQYRRPGSPETHAAAARALALSEHASDVGERLMTGALLVMYHVFFDGDAKRAAGVLEVLRDARTAGEQDPMVRVTMRLAESIHAWASGEEARAAAAAIDGLEVAASAGIDAWDNRLLGQGVAAALGTGDLATARRLLGLMARDAPGRGRFDVGNLDYYAAWDAFVRGDLARAELALERAAQVADEVDFPLARSLARIAAGVLRAESGRLAEGRALVREARAIAEDMASRFLLFSCSLVEADIAARLGEDDVGLLEDGLAIGRQCACYNAFWVPASMLARLCTRALEAGVEVEYVEQLVRRRRVRPDVLPADLETWPWPLRVYTLGRFEVSVEGVPLAAPGAQRVPLRVLKATIALGRRNVRKDRLIDAIWPDADGDAGARAFDTAIHRLRNVLGTREAVGVSDGCVHLDPEILWTDVGAVEELLSRVEQALEDGLPARAQLDRALDLYRGKLLDTEGEEAWLFEPRRRLHDRFLEVVLRAAKHLEESGQAEQAVAVYHRALSVDEASEALARRLMACHLRSGRRSEAVGVYERCRNVLAIAGEQPSRETHDLLRACGRTTTAK